MVVMLVTEMVYQVRDVTSYEGHHGGVYTSRCLCKQVTTVVYVRDMLAPLSPVQDCLDTTGVTH